MTRSKSATNFFIRDKILRDKYKIITYLRKKKGKKEKYIYI